MLLTSRKFLIMWQLLRLELNYMQAVVVSDTEQMKEGNMSKDHDHIHSQFHIDIQIILLVIYPIHRVSVANYLCKH